MTTPSEGSRASNCAKSNQYIHIPLHPPPRPHTHTLTPIIELFCQVTIATDLGKVVTRLQLERSEVAFYIFTNGSKQR